MALTVQALAHEGALLLRDGGEPSAAEVESLLTLLTYDRAALGAAPSDPRVAEVAVWLPPGWSTTPAAAPPAVVFVDGVRVPFKRPQAPGWEGRDLAYYRHRTGGLALVLRLHRTPEHGRLLAVRGDWRLASALGGLRLVRQPRRLARAAAWTTGGALLLLLSAPWRRSDSVPPLLMAFALAGWAVFGGLVGTWWSPVSYGGSLLLVSLPLLERLGVCWRRLQTALPVRLQSALGAVGLGALFAALTRLTWGLVRAYQTPGTDHAAHLALVESLIGGGRLLPHPVYHLLVALGAGFQPDGARIATAAAQTLTCLVLARVALSLAFAADLAKRAGHRLGYPAALLLAAALFSPAPLPTPWQPGNLYLGQLSPVAWHNPTVTAVLPAAIGAFWLLLRVRSARSVEAVALSLVLVLSAATKPSFTLAFLPLLGLLALLRRLPPGVAFVCAVPTLLVLGWQYVHWAGDAGAGIVAVRPLAIWRLYSPWPAASTLLSLTFPIAVTLFAARDLRHRDSLLWAWLLAAIAVLEMALLAEPGPRFTDFNYYWGVVPAVHLLFLTAACELLVPRALAGSRRGFAWCCWVLLLLHAASGVYGYCHPFQMPDWGCAF